MKETSIRKTACIGAGVIGASYALNFAWKGYPTALYDISDAALESAGANIRKSLDVLLSNDIVTPDQAGEIEARIRCTCNLSEALDGAGFVQESGPEHYEKKQTLLKQIEAAVDSAAIIATSTSGLLITKIAEHMTHPERFVGGHPYNPPHLMPLVEVVKGERTQQWAVDAACRFYASCGKEPVVLNKEVSGFIANRLQVAVFREIIDLVQRGICSLADADTALLYGLGLRWGIMGPNMIFHLGAGDQGIGVMMERQRESIEERLKDMATWKRCPENLPELASGGIKEAVGRRTPEEGRTIPEIAAYRDRMLLALLKLHRKL